MKRRVDMKKILCFAAIFLLVFSLSACIHTEKPPVTSSDVPVSSDTEPTVTTNEPAVTTEPPMTTETAEPTVTTAEPVVTTAPKKPTVTEPPVVTTEPPVTTEFNFEKSDLSEYILLGKYLGIEVLVPAPAKVSEEDVDTSIEAVLAELPKEAMVYNRACRMGDKVNIDFGGSLNGDIFEEGAIHDYTVLLDDVSSLPGFEEKIAGMIPGDKLMIDITFPEDANPGLAGHSATFAVTLNYIYPELTDEIAVKYLEASSAAEYRKRIYDGFAAEIEMAFTAEKEAAAWTKALANSCIVRYPEPSVDKAFMDNVAVYTALAESYDMTYEEFFPVFYGLTIEDAEDIMRESAKNIVAQQLLLYAIARDMGIDVSDEQFEADLVATAAVLGFASVDELILQLGGTRETLKEDKIYSQVISAIMEQANFVIIN